MESQPVRSLGVPGPNVRTRIVSFMATTDIYHQRINSPDRITSPIEPCLCALRLSGLADILTFDFMRSRLALDFCDKSHLFHWTPDVVLWFLQDSYL